MKNFNYLIDQFLHHTFKIILSIQSKNMEKRLIILQYKSTYRRICVSKIENKITFKIKIGYYLQPLTPETMKLLARTKSEITKDENGENAPHVEITEVALVHCNIVNNKLFGHLLDISPKNFIFLKTLNSEFSYIEVWFTEPLLIEDKINITLVIN